MQLSPILLLSAALAASASSLSSQAPSRPKHYIVDASWVPIKIERPRGGVAGPDDQGPNVIHFRNGHQLIVHLFSVEFLGQLPRQHKPPLLILGAAGCYSCDIEQQIYPVPPDTSEYDYGDRAAYSYPGSMSAAAVESSDTTPFYRGRMFVGRCLVDPQPVVVWFEQQRDKEGHWRSDVYRLRIEGDSARGEFLKPMPNLSTALKAVRAGACFEVRGLNQAQY